MIERFEPIARYAAKSMLFVLTCTISICSTPAWSTPATVNAQSWLPARFYKSERIQLGDTMSEEPFTEEVLIWNIKGKPCVRFDNFMPDSGQVLSVAGMSKFTNPQTIVFQFTDNWGNTGKGTVKQSGSGVKVSLVLEKRSAETWSSNAGRNYPDDDFVPRAKLKKSLPATCKCDQEN